VKVFLLRKVGEGKAKELLLSGRLYNAEQAKDFGLVNEVVDADKLEQHVYDFAQELIQNNSGQSMQFTKQMIAEVQSKGLDEGLQYAAEQNAMARNSEDCKKGIAAFLNKETPSW
jgi:methylglutaconyl-CoA hydratase